MNIPDLRQKVADTDAALSKLNDQRSALLAQQQDIQTQRRAGCKALAEGDSKALKAISHLDAKLLPVGEKIEGFQSLISEAEQTLASAKADLKQAEDDQSAALSAFLAQKNADYKQTAKASLDGVVKEILQALAEAEKKLGLLNILSLESGPWPSDKLYGLHLAFSNYIEGSNLRMLMASGIPGTISLWPAVVNDEDIQRSLPGGGPVSCKSVCDVLASLRQASWMEEFQNKAE